MSILVPSVSLHKVAILGNYLPRQCGIATFTTDLSNAIAQADCRLEVDVFAMVEKLGTVYPPRVKRQIVAGDLCAYAEAATALNSGRYDVLSVQHEYGIFGGEAGMHLLSLLKLVKMPIVTTLHTVLENPSSAQRLVTKELIQLSERIVVMSEAAIRILEAEYDLPRYRVDFIPHGIPDFTTVDPSSIKPSLDMKGPLILTFGLLSPDKGVQFAIGAMPKVLEFNPDAVFVVLGATHPKVKESNGESYRESLIQQAQELGVEKSIRFVDRFVQIDELVQYLVAADVYVTPSLNPKQITSGTLAYALGACKSVVSTPYLYAKELLGDGRGTLVPFRDSEALADAVIKVLSAQSSPQNKERRLPTTAHRMLWPEVGEHYLETIRKSGQKVELLVNPTHLPVAGRVNLDPTSLALRHLSAMTDDTGLFQHADHAVPNRSHGYCVDDNARALLFMAMLEQDGPLPPRLEAMQGCYLAFVHDSFNPDVGKFRNFMGFQRDWLEPFGSDDSHARTMWALGSLANRSRKLGYRAVAIELFSRATPAIQKIQSPRSWAYAILGAEELLQASLPVPGAQALLEEMTHRLEREFDASRSENWIWFESVVTYANARLSQAMIIAGQRMNNAKILSIGLESLEWLMDHQHDEAGRFRGIGSDGHFHQHSTPALFDQQPLEAWATVSACLSASRATENPKWKVLASNAFAWLMGRNALSQSLYDPETGGCRDGIHFDRLNENQGAESTLSFLCALTELRAASDPVLQNVHAKVVCL